MSANPPETYQFCTSLSQRRLWFLDQYDGGSGAYNIPTAWRLRGRLDRDGLARSLGEIVQRHEVLRTRFLCENDEPVQLVCSELRIPLHYLDSSTGVDEALTQAMRVAQEEAIRPFDLGSGPLLRATLVRVGDDDHVFVLTVHHIVADGWSMEILWRELGAAYAAACDGEPCILPELPIQYADFSVWQREWVDSDEARQRLSYWTNALASARPTLALQLDRPRPGTPKRQGGAVQFAVPPETAADLTIVARRHRTTLFVVLAAAVNVLFYRYTQQDDICIGYPVANRRRAETQGLIGCFVNTLVLRSRLRADQDFGEFLAEVREAVLRADENQDVPLEHLVDALKPARSPGQTPLFQVMFGFRDGGDDAVDGQALQLKGLAIQSIRLESETAKFDLSIDMESCNGRLVGAFEYDRQLFEQTTIERMARHFETLLASIAKCPGSAIGRLPLLSPAEYASMSIAPNTINFDATHDQSVPKLFEDQVELTPDATAIVFGQHRWSYRELNCRANRLAGHLRDLGVKPGVMVGVLLERGPDLIVSLLAILKSGGAYLPLDVVYPTERIEFMLNDAATSVLVSTSSLRQRLPAVEAPVVCLDLDDEQISRHRDANPDIAVDPRHLAYCLFTSGSTGRPKGVQVERRALSNLLCAARVAPGLSHTDAVLSVISAVFDPFGLDVYLPLITGAKLVLAAKDDAFNPAALARLITVHGVTVMCATPPTWRMILESGVELRLRKALCGGEAIDRKLATGLQAIAAESWNLYGPTETTIFSSRARILGDRSPTLGQPIENTQLYVLDPFLNPTPIGVIGEMFIAGAGLARGYANRPDLTADRFLPNPFGPPGSRMYRTGDLGRRLPDGDFVYLGRADFQVKLRGFRIELGEIEDTLRRCQDVRECVVVAHGEEAAERRLVAYVVPRDAQRVSGETLAIHLRQALPDYMVPGAWVFLARLPLSVNGKIDRKALPAPALTRQASGSHFVPARSPVEIQLAAIWADILRIERVGTQDNFFALGGNSMLAIRCLARIHSVLGRSLPISAIFEHQTIAALAQCIDQGSETAPAQSVRITCWFDLPLAPTLYLFPAAGMHGAAYFQLAGALASACKLRVIEPLETPATDGAHSNVQGLAARYAQAILAQEPDAAITIAGHSFGGSMAFETARLLEQQSKRVRLILLDATLVNPRVLGPQLVPDGSVVVDTDGVEVTAGTAGPKLPPSRSDCTDEGPLRDLLSSAQDLYREHHRMFDCYVPAGSFGGLVVAIVAENGILNRQLLPRFLCECRKVLRQDLVVRRTPGDHLSMISAPDVEALATTIARELGQSRTTARAESTPHSVALHDAD